MGVVHLARRGDGPPGGAQGAATAHRRRRRGAAATGARGRVAEPDPAASGSPRSSTPTRGRRCRTSRPATSRASRCTTTCRGGADQGQGPDLVRRLPRRGGRVGARGRRAAPRREAVERADGGPHADPHRLRPGPGRRRPEADPHRLAARHARLPRARDPVRRGRDRGLRRALVGGHGRLRRHRSSRRSAAARRWRSWTGSAAASTTSPASPIRCASWSPLRSTPSRAAADARRACWAGCGPRSLPRSRTPAAPPVPEQAHDAVRRRSHLAGRPADGRAPRWTTGRRDRHEAAHRAPTVMERDPRALRPPPPLPAEQGRAPVAERARRATLLVVGGAAVRRRRARRTPGSAGRPPDRRLAAAQRLAGRQRGGRAPASARPQVVRRRPAARPRPPGTCSGRSPGTVMLAAVERRARGRGGAALLRVRRRRDDDAVRLRRGLRGRAVERPGRLPGALAAVAGGQPARRDRWSRGWPSRFVLLVLATGLGGARASPAPVDRPLGGPGPGRPCRADADRIADDRLTARAGPWQHGSAMQPACEIIIS